MSILNKNALKLVCKEVVNSTTIFLGCSCFWYTFMVHHRHNSKGKNDCAFMMHSLLSEKEIELSLIKFSLIYVIKRQKLIGHKLLKCYEKLLSNGNFYSKSK